MRVLPLILQFVERHPHLRPCITFTDRVVDVAEDGIDVAVRIGAPDVWPDTLGHLHLGIERVTLFAAPSIWPATAHPPRKKPCCIMPAFCTARRTAARSHGASHVRPDPQNDALWTGACFSAAQRRRSTRSRRLLALRNWRPGS
ncbi:LysR substrate-binding domain-containing protein [Lichenicola cladoniae]|uniref:LysR substrate-binding domain-containing protein n=1 Tax=Lichenicola cladoniae TaxID=1484109 RepID=UPI0038D00B9E